MSRRNKSGHFLTLKNRFWCQSSASFFEMQSFHTQVPIPMLVQFIHLVLTKSKATLGQVIYMINNVNNLIRCVTIIATSVLQ